MLKSRFPRVAIAHEWLTVPGGSERVLLAILELVPHAELFTSVYDPSPWPKTLTSRPVHASFLSRLPDAQRNYPKYLPLMDAAFRSFDLAAFDLVISSNHACAKNVRTPSGALHVCYCHTPMRYAWDPSFLKDERLGRVARGLVPAGTAWLRRIDRLRAKAPHIFVANSRHVAGRIRDCYGRNSCVIHPPVDVDRFLERPHDPSDTYLVFGRVVPYKHVEIAIAACERLGRRLIVAGEGRALDRLRSLCPRHTKFVGCVREAEVPGLLARARALLHPGVEDFGIVAVEAQAAGVPVIAYGVGGVLDSVIDGKTGVLYRPGSVEGLCAAIERFEQLTFDESAIRANSRRFAPEIFAKTFGELLAASEVSPR